MGYILLDHTQGGAGPPEPGMPFNSRPTTGIKQEWDTYSCVHCQRVMRVIIHGPARKSVENADRCTKCAKPICVKCARAMDVTGVCPGPLRDAIEKRLLEQRNEENLDHWWSQQGRVW